MAYTINDIALRPKRIATADADGVAGPCRVFAMGHTNHSGGAATVIVNNAATKAGGGRSFTIGAQNNRTKQFSFGDTGVVFDTGLSLTSGGGASSYGWVTYIEEAG